jgi:hypothetical protein
MVKLASLPLRLAVAGEKDFSPTACCHLDHQPNPPQTRRNVRRRACSPPLIEVALIHAS